MYVYFTGLTLLASSACKLMIFLLADNAFAKEKKKTINKAKIMTKPREIFMKDNDIKFNDEIIKLARSDNITLTQEKHVKSIKFIDFIKTSIISSRHITKNNLSTKKQYVAERIKKAYIALIC